TPRMSHDDDDAAGERGAYRQQRVDSPPARAGQGQFGLNRMRLFRKAIRSDRSLAVAAMKAAREALPSPSCSRIASVNVLERPSCMYGAVLPTPQRVLVRNTEAPVLASSTLSARPGPMSWRLRSL